METPILMTRKEVAEALRVSTRAVNKWAREGILRPVRLPGRKHNLGYRRDDIEKLVTTETH
jgi:excisionase family DNA binding protein